MKTFRSVCWHLAAIAVVAVVMAILVHAPWQTRYLYRNGELLRIESTLFIVGPVSYQTCDWFPDFSGDRRRMFGTKDNYFVATYVRSMQHLEIEDLQEPLVKGSRFLFLN